ncbi:LytTR family DNA-binding domain-containing protein [Parabacteroides sp. PF5-6]|uniref:LytTR family DNA-binding domain-containing protein n=1 Tax=Parabacteroides sp. PF5-6 TaxID=1742403 RepID=UPI002406F05B|nr:LytTR family DNA-binding domain-containing protein [Parabacteroides sp. PF5-6]MDF9830206.1 DNA-binding LytR/AlgR family response regulator [Parabacteroides sp. PF5-6]
MNKIQSFLSRPAVANRRPWVIVGVSSLLVFFLLGAFQPFGLENRSDIKWFAITGFALVTALVTTFVGYVFPLIFKRFYDPNKWTTGKSLLNLCLLILLIGFGNFLFDWIISDRPAETFFAVLTAYMLVTFLIGLIPATVSSVLVQNYALKQNLREAKEINKHLMNGLSNRQPATEEKHTLVLTGNTKDQIELNPDDLLYMEACGNYVRINYRMSPEQGVGRKQLRTTIAQLEKDLADYPAFVRCHRAFIVNVSAVSNVEGNSQGYQLSLRDTDEEVPVSRSYTKIIRTRLNITV